MGPYCVTIYIPVLEVYPELKSQDEHLHFYVFHLHMMDSSDSIPTYKK